MSRRLNNCDGIALIVMVFTMLVFSMLGAVVTSMQGSYFETSRAHVREEQAFFVGDAGIERGKELLNDNSSWRPPDPPGYLREYMTVGGAQGHYDIYVNELGGGQIELQVESEMDVE